MRKATRFGGLVVAMAMVVGISLASSAFAQDSTSDERLVFKVGTINDVRTFNPLKLIESPEYETAQLMYDLLFNFDEADLTATTALASEVPTTENGGISADGLTWTIPIRTDMKWSDGTPLTARDVAFTYSFILENDFSLFTSYFPFTAGCPTPGAASCDPQITAPDDSTLVWKTTKAVTAPLYPPWVYIIPEHVFSGMSKDEVKKFENYPDPVTSGPFNLTEWKKGDFWRLEANPDYPLAGGPPNVDEVVFQVFGNQESMMQALQSGEIDYAYDVPTGLAQSYEGNPEIAVRGGGPSSFVQMSFNQCYVQDDCQDSTGHPALEDLRVRTAIAHAIDKQTLVDKVRLGYAEPGVSIIPPTAAYYHWTPEPADAIDFDIAQANQILDDAGYADTDNDGVREMPNGGDSLDFRFVVRTENPDTVKAGEFITGWLKQIGIATETEAVTDGKLVDIWYALDYDLYIWGWGPDPDPDFMVSTFTTDQCGVWSDTCYSNEEYDQLYKDQQVATNLEERKAIIDEMQSMIYNDLPEVVLWYDKVLEGYRKDRWTGFVEQPSSEGYYLFQYGNYSYVNIEPVSSATSSSSGGGPSPILWIGLGVLVVVVVGAIMLSRRRKDEDVA